MYLEMHRRFFSGKKNEIGNPAQVSNLIYVDETIDDFY